MAKDYTKLVAEIVDYIGGKENIKSLTHCMTRLRFKVNDESKVKKDALLQTEGVITLMVSGGQYQVVIGTHVDEVMKFVEQVTGVQYSGQMDNQENGDSKSSGDEKKNIFSIFIDTVSGIFLPLMGIMSGVALIKAIMVMCSTFGWMASDSTTYKILYAIGDGFFHYMPLFLAYTAAKKFKAERFVSVAIAASLLYPDISAFFNEGAAVDFFGIPVIMISYASSVLPIIVAVYAQSWLEKGLNRVIPKIIRSVFVPVLTLCIIVPLSLLVIGPITNYVGVGIGNGLAWLINLFPPVAGFVIGCLWPVLIIFGLHWGLVPIVFNNIAVYGGDILLSCTYGCNFAMAGAVLAVWLKSRKSSVKKTAGAACVSALVGGITEPAIYGINIKYKWPFLIACLCTGIGGIFPAVAGTMFPAVMTASVFTLPALLGVGKIPTLLSILIGFFGTFVLTYFFGFNDAMVKEE